MTPVETVLEFLERINQRDPNKLAELMSEDHSFIDSLGGVNRGREKMRAGWRMYYGMCLDYWATHEDIFPNGDRVGDDSVKLSGVAAFDWKACGRLSAADAFVEIWERAVRRKNEWQNTAKSYRS